MGDAFQRTGRSSGSTVWRFLQCMHRSLITVSRPVGSFRFTVWHFVQIHSAVFIGRSGVRVMVDQVNRRSEESGERRRKCGDLKLRPINGRFRLLVVDGERGYTVMYIAIRSKSDILRP